MSRISLMGVLFFRAAHSLFGNTVRMPDAAYCAALFGGTGIRPARRALRRRAANPTAKQSMGRVCRRYVHQPHNCVGFV